MTDRDECLICGAPLIYLETGISMECAICHKVEESKTSCEKGHYVCNNCHTRGIDRIVGLCMKETSTDPYEIFSKLAELSTCHMHGPEHHIMVGSALLTAYHNAGGSLELEKALGEMQQRGKQVPGGACGFWGACGGALSAGMFLSIALGTTPLSRKAWGMGNQLTSRILGRIGAVGGPRCCKRNSFLAISEAVEFVRRELQVEMTVPTIICSHFPKNNQCLGNRCPFHPASNNE